MDTRLWLSSSTVKAGNLLVSKTNRFVLKNGLRRVTVERKEDKIFEAVAEPVPTFMTYAWDADAFSFSFFASFIIESNKCTNLPQERPG
ncbi:unnamed protein product [Victoria cruziana]